ncbi:MAG: hypothetical protein ACW99U_08105 [Candidatus Thorarchaeota archaeon]|jgi:hypothetical protein
MRNFLGALISVFVGASLTVNIQGLVSPSYPAPLDIGWFILAGSESLVSSVLDAMNPTDALVSIAVWIIMGMIAGLAANSRWNTVRSVLWMGALVAILGLVSVFALTPGLWFQEQAARNAMILIRLLTALTISTVSMIGALPTTVLIQAARKKTFAVPPERIVTRCECGAVFKSKPLICSECGRVLDDTSSN